MYQGVAIHLPIMSRVHRIRMTMLMNRIERQQEPETRYTKYVQRLMVVGSHNAAKLVPLCPNLKSLAIKMSDTAENRAMVNPLFVPNGLSYLNLRRLAISWFIIPSEHRSCHNPIFRHLTHLQIDPGDKSYWDGLSKLDNLTNMRVTSLDREFRAAIHLLFVLEMIKFICQRFPPSLKYMTACFHPQHSSNISTEEAINFCCEVEIGKFDHRVLFDWSNYRPIQVIFANMTYRNFYDFMDSWIYLPHCYHDIWRRAELEIDNRNRTYGLA